MGLCGNFDSLGIDHYLVARALRRPTRYFCSQTSRTGFGDRSLVLTQCNVRLLSFTPLVCRLVDRHARQFWHMVESRDVGLVLGSLRQWNCCLRTWSRSYLWLHLLSCGAKWVPISWLLHWWNQYTGPNYQPNSGPTHGQTRLEKLFHRRIPSIATGMTISCSEIEEPYVDLGFCPLTTVVEILAGGLVENLAGPVLRCRIV